MKTLQEWQEELSSAAAEKFEINKKWSEQDRLLSILRQLADVGKGIQWEQGLYKMTEEQQKEYKSTDHRIAALIADILILCEKRKTNLEKELSEVLKWYRS